MDGSPFARIIRATVLEFGFPHKAIEVDFPLPAEFAKISPALQVPVLEHNRRRLFGTEVIRAYLHALPNNGDLAQTLTRTDHHWDDLQVLSAIHAMGEAVVLHNYADWAGMKAVGRNLLGFVPGTRSRQRALSLLDWLDDRVDGDGFWSGAFCAADLALTCLLLWTDSRAPLPWRGRPGLEALVARVELRPSLRATAPRDWSADAS